MTLGQVDGKPLDHGQQLCEILSRFNMAMKSHGPDTHFLVFMHCDLDLEGMTFGQDHDTPVDHGQQLFEILSITNMTVKSYDLDKHVWYVCT